ncbi:MAG: Ig-like domain-containing protein [Marmoricola sp.]
MSRSSHRSPSPRAALLPAVAGVLALLGALAFLGTPLSGATFTSSSSTRVAVSAAADWAPPTVAVDPPSGTLTGTVAVSATAADTGTGVASVTLQYAVSGSGSWQTLCTATGSPYSCSWNTALVADGSYDLRATAVDKAGFTATSDSVTVRVANQLGVVLAPVPDPVHGTVTLRVDYVNANATVPLVLSLQYVTAGGTKWANLPATCASSITAATTWSCALDTTKLTSGADYDFRAVGSTLLGVATYFDYQYAVTVDNTAPTTVLSVPSGTLSGTVGLSATATDGETSVVSTAFQYRPTGASTWTTACTDAVTPYGCSINTTSWAGGSYDFRTVATDEAGNTGTSAVTTRVVDNTIASVSVTAPASGAVLRGTVTLTADAASTKGVASVALQYRVGSTGTWQTVCVDTTAPFSCAWDSTVVTKSAVDLRAIMTDTASGTLTSSLVTVSVDNSVLQAQDVQASNGGVRGKPDSGDTVVLTYSGIVDPATILAGWTGASTAITATVNDAAISGGPGTGDWLGLAAGKAAVNLGQVAFGENYVKARKSATFAATLSAATQTVAGQQVTVVTVTLGSVTQGGGSLRQTSTAGTTSWTPSAAARTPSGVACSTTAVSETGTADQDL